ncbi:helix-turn-helix domain-containing protein, partial [Komagataeibacter swingsii]
MSCDITGIAERLQAARKTKGLSQRELSELAGVPQAQISRIEAGTVDLRLSS